MKLQVIGLALALGLTGATQANEPWQISPEGVGPIRTGMTTQQVKAALRPFGNDADIGDIGNPKVCEELLLGGRYNIGFMVQRNRVARVSAGSGVVTARGIKYGAAVAAVHKAYPKLEREIGDGPRDYVLYWWKTPAAGLRFEIDNRGEVVSIHGGNESIRFTEKCA